MNTTISKAAQSAELLAASLLINRLVKEAEDLDIDYDYDVLLQYRNMLDSLATIVTATFKPAEA
tara:strand:- start:733 stop:924 length:192 start_codon:yes stop_codon:yes gene_type:complete